MPVFIQRKCERPLLVEMDQLANVRYWGGKQTWARWRPDRL